MGRGYSLVGNRLREDDAFARGGRYPKLSAESRRAKRKWNKSGFEKCAYHVIQSLSTRAPLLADNGYNYDNDKGAPRLPIPKGFNP